MKQLSSRRLAGCRLAALTACSFGYNVGFGLKYTMLTSFLAQLGVPPMFGSLAWLCSPFAGMLQPIMGHASDKYRGAFSRYGRRRPFLVLGALTAVMGHVTLAFCVDLGHNLGDEEGRFLRPRAVGLFIFGFCVLELGNNLMAIIHRALIPDLLSEEEQFAAFSGTGTWCSAGQICANALAAASWESFDGFDTLYTTSCGERFNCANTKVGFLVAASVVVMSTGATCLAAFEKPADRLGAVNKHVKAELSPMQVARRDPFISGTYAVTALAWGGWVAFQVYGTHFTACEVFGGNPDPTDFVGNAQYIEGGKAAGAALITNTLAMLVTTLCLPEIRSRLGLRFVWSGAMLLAAFGLAMSAPIRMSHHTGGVQLWLAFFGPLFAVQQVFPNSVVASRAPPEIKGALIGYINIFVCVPQLIIALLGGFIVSSFGTDVAAFLAGAACIGSGGVLLWYLVPEARPAPAAADVAKVVRPVTFGSSWRWSRRSNTALSEPLLPRAARSAELRS